MPSATTMLTSAIDARKSAQTQSVAAYFSTTMITGLNIFATLGVSGILSRTWTKSDFLLFTTLNRYLSLLYCLVSLSLGFGVVQLYRTINRAQQKQLLSNALLIVAGIAITTTVTVQWYSQEIIAFIDSESIATPWALMMSCLWVASQAIYHVLLSYQRGLGNTRAANSLMFIVKTLIVLSLSLLAWLSQSISVTAYYGWVSFAIFATLLSYLWKLKPTWNFSANKRLCYKLSSISWSRSLESILKHALMPIVVTLLYTYNQTEAAGGIVVVAMLLRGIESLFQPLVLMALADSLNTKLSTTAQQHRVQAAWDCILIISIPATACLIFFAKPVLALWLGESYRELGYAFQLISLALPAVLATVLLRGNLDAQYRISPLALTCFSRILLALLIFPLLNHWELLNLRTVSLTLAGLCWLQFAAIFWLLRRHYSTSLFPIIFFRYCQQKLGWEGTGI